MSIFLLKSIYISYHKDLFSLILIQLCHFHWMFQTLYFVGKLLKVYFFPVMTTLHWYKVLKKSTFSKDFIQKMHEMIVNIDIHIYFIQITDLNRVMFNQIYIGIYKIISAYPLASLHKVQMCKHGVSFFYSRYFIHKILGLRGYKEHFIY